MLYRNCWMKTILYCISFKYTDLHKFGVHALNHINNFKDQLHQSIIYLKFNEGSQSYTFMSLYHNQHIDCLHQPFPINPYVFSSVPHMPNQCAFYYYQLDLPFLLFHINGIMQRVLFVSSFSFHDVEGISSSHLAKWQSVTWYTTIIHSSVAGHLGHL